MDYNKYIVQNKKICGGVPTFKGTRVTLRTILASLAEGDSEEVLLDAFPSLKPIHIKAAIAFAAMSAHEDLPRPGMPAWLRRA